MLKRFTVLAIVVAGLLAAPAVKAQDDPADLGLWQTVQARNTPADYMVYLEIFPNGKFAALARIRAQAVPGTAPQPQPVAEPQPDPDAPQFSVTPAAARVGQRFTVNCGTIPTGGSNADVIIVVPAGSPPTTQPKGSQGVGMDYVANCQRSGGDGTFQLGPLPPGLWEFRWLTTLYNLENRLEVKATVQVTVR